MYLIKLAVSKQNRDNIQGYSSFKFKAKDAARSEKYINNWIICKYKKGVQKGKPSLLIYNARCKCSMETNCNSVKVKLDKNIILKCATVIILVYGIVPGMGKCFLLGCKRKRKTSDSVV